MIFRVFALGAVLTLSAACGTKSQCGPTTCQGCCSVIGECLAGSTTQACGTSGALCQTCAFGQLCVGSCFGTGSTGGGNAGTGGGSSGVGGGSSGVGGGSSGVGGGSSGVGGGSSGVGGGSSGVGGGSSGVGGGSSGVGGGSSGVGGGSSGVGGGSSGPCDTGTLGTTGPEFAKALGLCSGVIGASFVSGDPLARTIRTRFGDSFMPREGSKMVHISTGKAVDLHDSPTYVTSPGWEFNTTATQSNYQKAACAPLSTTTPMANDQTELDLTLAVPQGVSELRFDYNFFTVEYPDYYCTQFTDRFVVAVTGQRFNGNAVVMSGEPMTSSTTALTICNSYTGPNANQTMISHTCALGASMLTNTGYGLVPSGGTTGPQGGATDWLTVSIPVQGGESLSLKLILLDEGDAQFDSAVLLDNFHYVP